MTLTQLEYITAVDTYKSFVTAAEKCFVTQPTLSMQIQKLEEELGIKLFDRSRQPVQPTEMGARIIEQARETLRAAHKISEMVRDEADTISGELTIGIIPTVAPYLLPMFLSSFLREHERLLLRIKELTTGEIIASIKSGEIDCGILATPLSEPGIIEMPLYYEPFVVYLSQGHHLLQQESVAVSNISAEEIWLLNEGHCFREQVLNLCKWKKEKTGNSRVEYLTGSVETLKTFVETEGGVTIIPGLAAAHLSPERKQLIRPFSAPIPAREISVISHKYTVKEKPIKVLAEAITSVLPRELKSKQALTIVSIR